jgi:hypothetical protein
MLCLLSIRILFMEKRMFSLKIAKGGIVCCVCASEFRISKLKKSYLLFFCLSKSIMREHMLFRNIKGPPHVVAALLGSKLTIGNLMFESNPHVCLCMSSLDLRKHDSESRKLRSDVYLASSLDSKNSNMWSHVRICTNTPRGRLLPSKNLHALEFFSRLRRLNDVKPCEETNRTCINTPPSHLSSTLSGVESPKVASTGHHVLACFSKHCFYWTMFPLFFRKPAHTGPHVRPCASSKIPGSKSHVLPKYFSISYMCLFFSTNVFIHFLRVLDLFRKYPSTACMFRISFDGVQAVGTCSRLPFEKLFILEPMSVSSKIRDIKLMCPPLLSQEM